MGTPILQPADFGLTMEQARTSARDQWNALSDDHNRWCATREDEKEQFVQELLQTLQRKLSKNDVDEESE